MSHRVCSVFSECVIRVPLGSRVAECLGVSRTWRFGLHSAPSSQFGSIPVKQRPHCHHRARSGSGCRSLRAGAHEGAVRVAAMAHRQPYIPRTPDRHAREASIARAPPAEDYGEDDSDFSPTQHHQWRDVPGRSPPRENPGARAQGRQRPRRRQPTWTRAQWQQWVDDVDPDHQWTVDQWRNWHAHGLVDSIHAPGVAHAPPAEEEDAPLHSAAAFLMTALRAHP